ncbi:MAG: hypothetical protein M1825_000088 [Sarcosagium campestre]|nr:MAG: hypothetical protein M1825_000088 [Sarcosagium campestre]
MSGASDKARFYLEQSVPELQELHRKKIFSKAEISSIAKKRSDFEHILNARGSYPSDYARYAEYEINLETLRRKRVKRLGIKVTAHSGQRRIFFIFDRATRKFHGDVALWMQYIEYARNARATKKLASLLTAVLRLHPTRPELWTYAARHAIESEADMRAARSFMQRGLRFCKQSRPLWLEYAQLETSYIAKIVSRRRILGLEQSTKPQETAAVSEQIDNDDDDGSEKDVIALPDDDMDEFDSVPHTKATDDEVALQNLDSTPALMGAIPLAIYDAAMKEFSNDATLSEKFFEMFSAFAALPCISNVLQHLIDCMREHAPKAPETWCCYIRQPLVGVETLSAQFPGALRITLERLDAARDGTTNFAKVAEAAIRWSLEFLETEGLDKDIKTVLTFTLSKTIRQFQAAVESDVKNGGQHCARAVELLEAGGAAAASAKLLSWSLERWPFDAGLQAHHKAVAIA